MICTNHRAVTAKITHINDHNTHVFAFFAFSSSHHDSKYIIQLSINEITAIIVTYFIKVDIKSHQIELTIFVVDLFSHGNHKSSIKSGVHAFAKLIFIKKYQIIKKKYFFIFL